MEKHAYNCILDKYLAQPSLDDWPLLRQAIAGRLAYLLEQQADHAPPRMTGDRTSDRQAFVRTYAATIAIQPDVEAVASHE